MKKISMKYVFIVFALLLSSQSAYAQRWDPISDSPTNIYSIACDINGNIWVGTNGDIYLYNGTSWEQKGSIMENVSTIAVAPNGDIYASGNTSLYKSTNGGNSWNNVFTIGDYIYKIVISPSGEVYFATSSGVYRPNGNSWINTGNVLSNQTIYLLAIAPNGTLYASIMNGDIIYRSTDGGVNWLPSNNFTNTVINSLAVVDNNTIIASSNIGTLKSIDGGQNWEQCNPIRLLDIMYNSKTGTLFAYSIGSLYFIVSSTDLGESWVAQGGLTFGSFSWDGFYHFAFNPITGETYTHNAHTYNAHYVYRFVDNTITAVTPNPVDFRTVPVGSSSQQSVRISNNGNAPLIISEIIGMGSPNDEYSLPNGETSITIPANGYYDLAVRFSPIINGMLPHGTITLIHNASDSPTTISLIGLGGTQALPTITAPNSVDFGNVTVGSSPQHSVWISNTGNAPLVISGISINGTGFTLPNGETSITIPANGSHDLAVRFSPTASTNYTGTLTLTHNASGSPTTISLTGTGVAQTFTFGGVTVGAYQQRPLRISNDNNAPFVISGISITGAGFSLPNGETSITIKPGNTYSLYVQFSPTAAGSYTGTLTYNYSYDEGNTSGTRLINLTGTGVVTTYTFGDVIVGSSSRSYSEIGGLVISGISITGAGFSLPNGETSITTEPGNNYSLYFQFSPTAAGSYTGALTYNYSYGEDNIRGSHLINLTGNGVVGQWKKLALNNLETWFANNGYSSHDPNAGDFGLMFPKGSGKGVIYQDGPILSGLVSGSTVRQIGSDYRTALQPGPAIEGVNIADPRYRIYMIRKDMNDLNPSEHFMSGPNYTKADYIRDYNEWPIGMGAPAEQNNSGNIVPRFIGDEQAWFVMNDLGATTNYYGTAPMGTEWQALFWAYDQSDALGNVLFKKYTIINKGTEPLENAYLSFWSDPDIGNATDDLVGSDIDLKMGYVYNGGTNDSIYGSAVPATGYIYLQGPTVRSNNLNDEANWNFGKKRGYTNLPMTAFTFFTNAAGIEYGDPSFTYQGGIEFYNLMKGLKKDGAPWINPQTGQASKFLYPGDPVTNTGWIDNQFGPRDVRMTMSSGPFTLAVGDTQELVVGIVVGQGSDRLSSIAVMKNYALIAQKAYDENFVSSAPEIREITITPNPLAFGDVQLSSYKDLPIVIKNVGNVSLRLTNFEISDGNVSSFLMINRSITFAPVTLAPSESYTATVSFRPDAIGQKTSGLTINCDALHPTVVPLSGNGLSTVFTLEPQDNTEYDEEGNIDFGEVSADDEPVEQQRNLKYITVKNTGGVFGNMGVAGLSKVNSAITITNLDIIGRDASMFRRVSVPDSSEFKPITLESGSQFVFTFEFAPDTPGEKRATTVFTHELGSTDVGFVAQAKLPVISLSNENINFGYVGIETEKQKDLPIVIQNKGNADLKITSLKITGQNASSFSLVLDSEIVGTDTIIIVPDATYTNAVRFKPDVTGYKTAMLKITTNIGDATINLSGDGTSSVGEPTNVTDDGGSFLFQNNPNPIRSGYDATIRYRVNTAGTINLTIYDVLGREVTKLVDEYKPAGIYSVNFSTKGLPSGVYFYRLRASGYEAQKKMLIIR